MEIQFNPQIEIFDLYKGYRSNKIVDMVDQEKGRKVPIFEQIGILKVVHFNIRYCYQAVLIGPFHILVELDAIFKDGLLVQQDCLQFKLRDEDCGIINIFINKFIINSQKQKLSIQNLSDYNFALLTLDKSFGHSYGFMGLICPLKNNYFTEKQKSFIRLWCFNKKNLENQFEEIQEIYDVKSKGILQVNKNLVCGITIVEDKNLGYCVLGLSQQIQSVFNSVSIWNNPKFNLIYQWISGINALPVTFKNSYDSFYELKNSISSVLLISKNNINLVSVCSLDFQTVVCSWSDNSVQIINVKTQESRQQYFLNQFEESLKNLQVLGRWILGNYRNYVIFIDSVSLKVLKVYDVGANIQTLKIMFDSLLIGDQEGNILHCVFDQKDYLRENIRKIFNKQNRNQNGHTKKVIFLEQVNEKHFASVSEDFSVKFWDIETLKEYRHFVFQSGITGLGIWGKFLVVSLQDQLQIFDKRLGVEIKKMKLVQVQGIQVLNTNELLIIGKRKIQVLNKEAFGICEIVNLDNKIEQCGILNEENFILGDEKGQLTYWKIDQDLNQINSYEDHFIVTRTDQIVKKIMQSGSKSPEKINQFFVNGSANKLNNKILNQQKSKVDMIISPFVAGGGEMNEIFTLKKTVEILEQQNQELRQQLQIKSEIRENLENNVQVQRLQTILEEKEQQILRYQNYCEESRKREETCYEKQCQDEEKIKELEKTIDRQNQVAREHKERLDELIQEFFKLNGFIQKQGKQNFLKQQLDQNLQQFQLLQQFSSRNSQFSYSSQQPESLQNNKKQEKTESPKKNYSANEIYFQEIIKGLQYENQVYSQQLEQQLITIQNQDKRIILLQEENQTKNNELEQQKKINQLMMEQVNSFKKQIENIQDNHSKNIQTLQNSNNQLQSQVDWFVTMQQNQQSSLDKQLLYRVLSNEQIHANILKQSANKSTSPFISLNVGEFKTTLSAQKFSPERKALGIKIRTQSKSPLKK